jgi:hypothetical protein
MELLPTTFGVNIKPLGQLRLRIVELIHLLIKLDTPEIKEAITQSDVLLKISKLIEQCPWNNFLHLKIN